MKWLIHVAVVVGAVALNLVTFAASATGERGTRQAQAPVSVWDGVYTEEQAESGRSAYLAQSCVRCHGETLLGTEFGPSLADDEFLSKWNGMSIGDLFKLTQETMPQDKPGRLSMQQTADIVAYIFKTNEFPAGVKTLAGDVSALQGIKIQQTKSTTDR